MLKSRLIIIISFFSLAIPQFEATAQEKNENVLLHPDKFYKKFLPGLKIKRNPPDSSFIKSYPNYLTVGMHILSPAIAIDLNPGKAIQGDVDASSKFRTNISDIMGFSASYRFISAGFAFLLKSGMNMHDNYAPSRYRTATIKYTSAGTMLQFKYLRIQGFTDINRSNAPDPSQEYMQRPDMLNKEFQFEGIYNFSWKKYSYIAPLTFSQRQVKSRAGFLLKAGAYYNQLSSDSTIISWRQQKYYDGFQEVTAIRSLSIRIAPGFGGNLVFLRRVYLSAAAFASFDSYFYKYLRLPDEKVKGDQTFVLLLDYKVSLGYQSRRLYAGLHYEAERRSGALQNLDVRTVSSYKGIQLGYRFDAPHLVKKIYKKTMPPGM